MFAFIDSTVTIILLLMRFYDFLSSISDLISLLMITGDCQPGFHPSWEDRHLFATHESWWHLQQDFFRV